MIESVIDLLIIYILISAGRVEGDKAAGGADIRSDIGLLDDAEAVDAASVIDKLTRIAKIHLPCSLKDGRLSHSEKLLLLGHRLLLQNNLPTGLRLKEDLLSHWLLSKELTGLILDSYEGLLLLNDKLPSGLRLDRYHLPLLHHWLLLDHHLLRLLLDDKLAGRLLNKLLDDLLLRLLKDELPGRLLLNDDLLRLLSSDEIKKLPRRLLLDNDRLLLHDGYLAGWLLLLDNTNRLLI